MGGIVDTITDPFTGADEARSAASNIEFNPFDVEGGALGSVSFNPGARTVSLNESPFVQGIRQSLGQTGRGLLSGRGPFQIQPTVTQGLQRSVPFRGGNTIGRQITPDEQNQGDLRLQGQGGLINQQLDLLRELARPQEEQAAASTASRLFNQGALGSTGGANIMGELSEAQQQADLQRQLQAIGLGQQQQQFNLGRQQQAFGQKMGLEQARQGRLGLGLREQLGIEDALQGRAGLNLRGLQTGQGLLSSALGATGIPLQVGQFGQSLGESLLEEQIASGKFRAQAGGQTGGLFSDLIGGGASVLAGGMV